MALMKSKVIPEDAVVIDEMEATEYVWNIISDWDSLSDTWALKYAPVVLGGINAFCGIMINRHFRNRVKLGPYGYFASVIPISLMPGMLTMLFHRHVYKLDVDEVAGKQLVIYKNGKKITFVVWEPPLIESVKRVVSHEKGGKFKNLTGVNTDILITTDLLLMRDQACPLCYEVRSAAIQTALGIAYPMVLAPTSAMMFAHRYATFRVPDLMEGPKVIFNFIRKLTRPFNNTLTAMVIGQVVASSILTYYEMTNNLTIRGKLMEIEAKIEKQKHM